MKNNNDKKSSSESFNFLYSINMPLFEFLAGLCTIISTVSLFLAPENSQSLSLIIWGVGLFLCLSCLLVEIFKIVHNERGNDYKMDSVFISFETIGNTKYTYQIFKNIQSKQQALSYYLQEFNWSGSQEPKLHSNIGTVQPEYRIYEKNKNHVVKLLFNRPLFYNESATIHFSATVDDSDNTASPHVQFKLEKRISVLSFRIILRNKPDNYNKTAILKRKPINTRFTCDFEIVNKNLVFDAKAKTYFHQIINPEVGYYYRIEWEKDDIVPPN